MKFARKRQTAPKIVFKTNALQHSFETIKCYAVSVWVSACFFVLYENNTLNRKSIVLYFQRWMLLN